MRTVILLLLSLSLFTTLSRAADCFCHEIDFIFTEDCCIGTMGELRHQQETHCRFRDYGNLGDFNRCCDSYGGKARCVLTPKSEDGEQGDDDT
ncbi:hypothetical protein K492DRAFT_174025 [Lichtheimia hyalospora FSU 10163]|nr:hypothetical protein K492DRAFT_174025 [Lichtheimia hyalospora FSU 10163]